MLRINVVLQKLFGVLVFAAIFGAVGEAALRLYYWNGETFSTHAGPMEARFERNFTLNRYDGPSRGPEVNGRKAPDVVRILVQGDSITWGQGVRAEDDVFTSRLLAKVRAVGVPTEMAVLAAPGREVDGHIAQLRKWGQQLKPSLIIYQWYVNDMELDKTDDPLYSIREARFRHIFFPRKLVNHSFLWFFLDYNAAKLARGAGISYEDYLLRQFGKNTKAWETFADAFREWVSVAKNLTARILVVTYPHMALPVRGSPHILPGIQRIQNRFLKLCEAENIATVDLSDILVGFENAGSIRASRYDAHPNSAAHAAISRKLFDALMVNWPELFSQHRARYDEAACGPSFPLHAPDTLPQCTL